MFHKYIPTNSQIAEATKLVNSMPLFKSSVTNNHLTLHGVLSEIIVRDSGLLGKVQLETRKPQLYNHDLINPLSGETFEIKTRIMKDWLLPPPERFHVHLPLSSAQRQRPSKFVFCMTNNTASVFYIIGMLNNEDKFLKGALVNPGLHNGNWMVKRSLLLIKIKDLVRL